MFSRASVKTLKRQQGLVLLVLIIIIALALISYSLSDLSVVQVRMDQVVKTQASLKTAKQALINYAVTHMDRVGDSGEMGFLPCPDVNHAAAIDEGKQNLNCNAQYLGSFGYLPWKSLDTPSLRDSSGNCLMYAVSNTYKLNPTNLLNDDSNGMFQLVDDAGVVKTGVLPEDRVVAIVFAAGKPLAGQLRNFAVGTDCGMDYNNMTAYLEGNGATNNGVLSAVNNSIDQFIHVTTISAQAATPYNDKFITITRNEIWSAILARSDFITRMTDLTEALALCLVEYSKFNAGRRLPWPAPMNLNNQNYRTDNSYDDNNGGLYAGRYPFIVNDSNNALGIVVDNIFDIGDTAILPPTGTNCDALALSSGSTANLSDDAIADAVDDNEEVRKLWKNWKDHFFYILSRDYEPGAGVEQVCAGNCNRVGGTEYSAIVIFSGTRFDTDLRADSFSGDNDDKADILNYLENGNELLFAAADGSDNYNSVGLPADSNDIMFCVTNEASGVELDVVPC